MAGIRFYITTVAPSLKRVAAGHIDIVTSFGVVPDASVLEMVEHAANKAFYDAHIHRWENRADIIRSHCQLIAYKEIPV